MKKPTKSISAVFITVFLAGIVLISGIHLAAADTQPKSSTSTVIPPYLEGMIAMLYPNASAAKLDQVRAQIVKQIAHNQKVISDTNGSVLSLTGSPLDGSGAYLYQYLWEENWNGGYVYNPTNMEGGADGICAEVYAPGMYENAAMISQMSSTNSGGDVYVNCKLGQSGGGQIGNIINIFVSNSSAQYGNWLYLGSAQVTEPYNWPIAYLWFGNWVGTFGYIMVGAATGSSTNQFCDVLGDNLWATSG